jgi:hypothetical protein
VIEAEFVESEEDGEDLIETADAHTVGETRADVSQPHGAHRRRREQNHVRRSQYTRT